MCFDQIIIDPKKDYFYIDKMANERVESKTKVKVGGGQFIAI